MNQHFTGFVPDTGSCGCSCSAPQGENCASGVTIGGVDDCSSAPAQFPVLVNGICNAFVVEQKPSTDVRGTAPKSGTGCPTIENHDIPAASFTTSLRACQGGGPACTGGTCLGDLSDGQQCVYIEGDVSCPAGPYVERTLAHSGLTDDRACPDCQCGPPIGTSCERTITLYSEIGCTSVFEIGTAQQDTCVDLGNVKSAVMTSSTLTSGACTAVDAAPSFTGSATVDDTWTYCCIP